MPTIIKKAETSEDLNNVLKTRYQVLGESGRKPNRMFTITEKVSDHFDAYPGTINVITYNGGKSIATIRGIQYNPEEAALNEAFDYSETFSNLNAGCFYLDMLAVINKYSGHHLIQKQLMKTIIGLLTRQGIKYTFFNVPRDMKEIAESLGFKSLVDEFHSEDFDDFITPSVIDNDKFYDDLSRNITDKEILRFQEVFYYIIFEPGEIMIVEQEKGSTAYLIESGEVEVLIRQGENIIPVANIGEGNLIGEIAMVTSEVRTASIMAKQVTSCIAFDREDFLNVMYEHPNRVLDIFKIFSKRLNTSNKKVAELSKKVQN